MSDRHPLCQLLDDFRQELAHLTVAGHALTPAQERRAGQLRRSIEFIEQLTTVFAIDCDQVPVPGPGSQHGPFVDGRFEGGNDRLFLELRIDAMGSGVISADLFRTDASSRSYVASLRTPPGVRISRDAGEWQIVASDVDGQQALGTLTLESRNAEGTRVAGTLFLESAQAGLPVRQTVSFSAERVSARMRRLGLEIERQEDVDPLPSFDFNGEPVTVSSSLEAAGFDIGDVGMRTVIPTPPFKWGTAQLHTLMTDIAQAQLNRAAWELHLLLLGESSRDGLFGIMFDSTSPLPRQGAAVFSDEIESRVASSHFPRKLIQTTVHELGHALNLAHRFERAVGRADSLSFMNYDWRYRGGNRRAEFWSNFDFTFDTDELEFLRHGPRTALIPGGAAFHSVNYWADGNGGYSPYVPETPINFLELTLSPPEGSAVFAFGQPVLLGISLRNLSASTFNFTPEILDPKSGLVEILIRRRDDDGPADIFTPVVERCFDASEDRLADLPPSGTIANNINITYGSTGFPFAEPGDYDVTALLVFFDRDNERDLIVRSNTLRIRVAFPHSEEEERDATVLLRDDVGLFFALGGSRVLDRAAKDLEEIRARRQRRAQRITDPVVANIVRCCGIDAGRPYGRFDGTAMSYRDGDRARAGELLASLDQRVLGQVFDRMTAESTLALAQKHLEAAKD